MNLGALKVQPSLSPATKKLLGEANGFVGTFTADGYRNCPDFVFPDVHGNLLVKMAHRTDKGMFFRFNNLDELSRIIASKNCNDEAEESYDAVMKKLMEEEVDVVRD